MSIAFIPIYIRYLGFEAYGLIGIFILLQSWLSLLDLGTVPTINREMARYTSGDYSTKNILDLLKSIEIITLIIAILVIIGLSLGANYLTNNWLNSKIDAPIVINVIKIMAVVVALKFFEGIYKSALIGLHKQVVLNIVLSIMSTLRGFGAILVLMFLSSTIEAFFIWQLIISIITTFVLGYLTYLNLSSKFFSGNFSVLSLKNIWKFASGIMGVAVIAMLLTQSDKLILSKLLSLEEFGYYSVVVVISSILGSLYAPIQQALIPKLNFLYAKKNYEELLYFYHFGAQLVTVLIGSMSLVLIFNAKSVLFLWIDDMGVAESYYITLQLLLVGRLLNNFMAIPYEMQLVTGWTSLTLKMNAYLALILVPTLVLIVPIYKMNGSALVLILINMVYLIVGIHIMHKKILISEKQKWYVQDIFKPMLYGGTMGCFFKLSIPFPQFVGFQLVYLGMFFLATFIAMICGSNIFKPLVSGICKIDARR